jgi:hypothetical protein
MGQWRLVLVGLPVLATTLSAATTATLLPPASGGQQGGNCVVHIAARDGDREVPVPCGTPGLIEADGSVGWIERAGTITPYLTDVSRGGTVRLDAEVPAGEAVFPPSVTLAAHERIDIYAIRAAPKGHRSFQRSLKSADSAGKLRAVVPSGQIIAVQFDAHGSALAISKPVTVPPGGSVLVPLRRPESGSDLLILLEKPAEGSAEPAVVSTFDAKGSHRPDVLLDSDDRLLAAWYGLSSGAISLTVQSDALFLRPVALSTRTREAVVVRDSLKALPKLTVAVGSIAGDHQAPAPSSMKLTLRRPGEKTAIRELSVKSGATYELEHLPAALFEVVLNVDGFVTGAQADLSPGIDARVEIPLKPIVISGVVFYGHDPARAEIRVLQHGEPLVVTSDDQGQYALTLWAPGRLLVDTAILDRPQTPPFRTMVLFDESRSYDIHVPALRLAARVFDVADTSPIAGAAITLRSTSLNPDTNRNASSVLQFKTSTASLTELPPVRPGSVDVTVRADGYEDAAPVTLTIDESMTDQVVDVPMKRSGDTVSLKLLLPDGSPAAGAEVAAASKAMTITWRGAADLQGIVRVPKTLGGDYLLLRHHEGASGIATFPASYDALPPMSFLPPGPPLTIRFVDSNSATIGPDSARVVAWRGGSRLDGEVLAFLTWSSAVTAIDGTWVARNLQQLPIRVLGARRAGWRDLDGGHLDALATEIPFPWPAVVFVRVAE